jgi:outer membrane receptor protein involved in Fe transport
MKPLSKLVFYAAAMSLLLVSESWAQISGGSIVGSVLDSSGAAIVGAKVTATNLSTNEAQGTVTNGTGYFEFPVLPAGRYVLEAENPGFERAKTGEFSLNSGTRPRFDLKMVIGQATESIQVEALAPLVNATTADLGVVVDQSKVAALPLNGRDFQQLVALQAGVYSSPDSANGQRGGIEFNGASAFGNNLLMDGVDMTFGETSASPSDKAAGTEVGRAAGNSTGNGIGRGSLINTISVEAIQEFKATGSAFSAEYGRATGGVLNLTTKSGSNQFHGTLFEFFRNDKLDANAFFSNRIGLPKPPLRWNQYGANLGGPIKRDRLFFFFNYEGAQASQNAPQTGNVPTPLLLGMVTPAIRQNLSLLPAPTSPTSNPLIGLNYHNDSRKNDENTFVSRGDWELGKQRLSVRYNYNHQDFTVPNLIAVSPSLFPTRYHNAEIADTESISSTMVNDWRLGFNRLDEFRHDVAFDSTPNFLSVSDVGISTGMDFLRFDSASYTAADNFTVVHGSHTLKAGFEIRNLRTNRFDFLNPSTTYLTVGHLIADTPDTVGLTIGGQRKLHNTDYGFFVQDNWRLSRRLQVNAGLRYEYFSPFAGGWNVKNSTDYFNPTYIAKKGDPMYQPDRTDFSPRLGIVFDAFGDQKLILRAGAALTYNPLQAGYLYDLTFTSDPRLPVFPSFLPGDVPPGTNLSFPFNPSFITQYISNPSLLPKDIILSESIADPNRRDERSGTWNFSVQRALTSNLAFQASYVGTRNWNQLGSRNLNLFSPQLGTRVHPNLGTVTLREFAGRSSYHALQLAVNQRLQHGVTFDFYYAYAKSLSYYGADSGASGGDATVQDANNIAGSYGPKNSDLRHSETLVVSYALPSLTKQSYLASAFLSGWNLQAIQTERSGLPINILAGVDEAGIRTAGFQRPDLVPSVNQYIRDLNTLQWLNPAAFDNKTPAAQLRYGDLGFNALRGLSRFGFDFALHKTFKIRERHNLTFRAEAFNILNHKVLNLPNSRVSSPTFGQITSGGDGRNVQLALKYLF